MVKEPPTEEVLEMKKKNIKEEDIIKSLEEDGYSKQQIYEAMNQSEIKKGVENKRENSGQMQESMLTAGPKNTTTDEIPVPTPSRSREPEPEIIRKEINPSQIMPQAQEMPSFSQQSMQYNYDDVQEIIESIVNEKWQQVISGIGDLSTWKSKTEDDISTIKQEILRFEGRLDKLQMNIIGKVDEYNKNITEMNTEIQALEKVFEKIMQPFTQNIKDLSRITKDLQEKTQKSPIRKK